MRALLFALVFGLAMQSNAFALCKNPKGVCEHLRYCAIVNLTHKQTQRLQEGLKENDSAKIFDATDQCQKEVGDNVAWEKDSAACEMSEIPAIVDSLRSHDWQCTAVNYVIYHCVQGVANGFDLPLNVPPQNCQGQKLDGAYCSCTVDGILASGHVQRQ